MTDELAMSYEFFSWKGFLTGGGLIALVLLVQSHLGFPSVWDQRPVDYLILIAVSVLVVGISSGAVLVYLVPPDQDVIGIAGLGSDEMSQHIALLLVLVALLQPMMSGFMFFYEYFGSDPVSSLVWVLLGFAAPSLGYAIAMLDRQTAIADDLRAYFSRNDRLDLATVGWLQGPGARTTIYRMGMLQSAVRRVHGLRIVGHEIVGETRQVPS
ncbi:MAG: hypothetical protein QXS20_08280 [Candidatus Thorarchaeota archaeon]